MIRILLFLLLFPALAHAEPARFVITEADGVKLPVKLFLPIGPATRPSIVALHGCAGPWPKRDDSWARALASQGHAVLLPDSFGARGLKSQCKETAHQASAYGPRRRAALAAARWLQARHFAPQTGILLLGWSDGGTTVLASIAKAPDLPAGLILGAVAFYPACARLAKDPEWHNAAPLLILMGAADDWTPPAPCQEFARRNLDVNLKLFSGAYHDFDVPNDPVHEITGLPYTKNGGGQAHAGENLAARAQALQMVPAFYATLLSP
jgi:dienelactone hydrolase